MLVIIIPVMALTVWYAWKYRASNKAARYEPNWHESTRLELVIWSAPLLIIICLGALTWLGTQPPSALYTLLAQVGTFYYFAFFISLLFLHKFETSKPVPDRVTG